MIALKSVSQFMFSLPNAICWQALSNFLTILAAMSGAQVWGTTFPVIEAEKVDELLTSFPQEFKALEQQLQARVLARVQTERDVQRRALIYSFSAAVCRSGRQFKSLLTRCISIDPLRRAALYCAVCISPVAPKKVARSTA